MNNKKIIVSTLALAMGAALAGSVSGTVAWFQYSTRAQVAYIGTSAHCSENLEVRVGTAGSWTTDLQSTDIQGAIDTINASVTENADKIGTDLQPITTGELAANAALPTNFYKNPIYQFTDKTTWGTADAANYVQFDLYFHVKDVDGKSTVTYLEKDLYLVDLTITSVQSDNSTLDLSEAVRVHFASNETTATNNLFAKKGSDATVATNVYGSLDLNNNGDLDKKAGYEWEDRGDALVYGDNGKQQVANNVAGTNVLANDANPYSIVANKGKLGKIAASEAGFKITVTIWLEGWTQLSEKPENNGTTGSAVWDPATYIGKKFQVGMRFACEAHVAH